MREVCLQKFFRAVMHPSGIDFSFFWFVVLSQVSCFQLWPVPYGSKEGELPFLYTNNEFRQLCSTFSESCRQCQLKQACCWSNFTGFVGTLVSVLVCQQMKGGRIAYCLFFRLSFFSCISHSVPWLMLAAFSWPLTKYWNPNIQLQSSSDPFPLCLITLSCFVCPTGL